MRVRVWMVTAVVMASVCGGLAATALLAWPRAHLGTTDDALARVLLPAFAGQVTAVDVYSRGGARVPVQLRQGRLWPLRPLEGGERLTVELTVRRPGWAGWLVGHRERRRFTIETPRARLLESWLRVKTGAAVTVV